MSKFHKQRLVFEVGRGPPFLQNDDDKTFPLRQQHIEGNYNNRIVNPYVGKHASKLSDDVRHRIPLTVATGLTSIFCLYIQIIHNTYTS
jgi:hypothetical protein